MSLNILVVDDSTNLRTIIKRFVGPAFEANFFEAANGEEAMHALQEQFMNGSPIDIVFLDWMMPKLSGFGFLMQMRETEIFKINPQVIMLTAETYSEQINAALKYNVSSYITKPFTADDLIGAIQKILNERGLKNAV